jgi:hypothetical protein
MTRVSEREGEGEGMGGGSQRVQREDELLKPLTHSSSSSVSLLPEDAPILTDYVATRWYRAPGQH